MTVKDTQLDLMHRKLEQHQVHEQRGLLLLKLGFVLTFLLYLLFNQHLYLGDALSWSAYFKDAASIFGFTLTKTRSAKMLDRIQCGKASAR